MRQTIRKLLALLVMIVAGSSGVWAVDVNYLYSYTTRTSYNPTQITNGDNVLLDAGWYYVSTDVTITGNLSRTAGGGPTNIILCDGAKLTINGKINYTGFDISFYAQSSGDTMGELTLTSDANDAITCDKMSVFGGRITVTGGITCKNSGNAFVFNRGQVIANKIIDGSGSDDGGVVLSHQYATDFIKVTTYSTAFVEFLKVFVTDDATPVEIPIDKIPTGLTTLTLADLNGRKISPKVYNITIPDPNPTGGTITTNKTTAVEGEPVNVTLTPSSAELIVRSAKYTLGTEDTNIDPTNLTYAWNNGFWPLAMPRGSITIAATFGPYTAKIGGVNYHSLATAFAAVASGETIVINDNFDNPAINYDFSGASKNVTIDLNGYDCTFGNISSKYGDLTIQGPGNITFGTLDNQGNLTIDGANVTTIDILTNVATSDQTLLLDNGAVLTTNTTAQWYAKQIHLDHGSHWIANNSLFMDCVDDFTFDFIDNASRLDLIECTVTGWNTGHLAGVLNPYIRPGSTLTVDGWTKNNLSLRKSWGLTLTNNFGANATVNFFQSATEPTAATFNPALYIPAGEPGANEITEIENIDGTSDFHMIVHIVPADGYWTDGQILFAMEGAAAPVRAKAPGIDLGQTLTLLKADQVLGIDRHDGAGWYYYKLKKEHNINAGYVSSIIDGYVLPKFNLETNSSVSGSVLTVTDGTANGWKAELSYDKISWKFDDSGHVPTTKKIVVKYNDKTLIALNDADSIASQIKTGSGAKKAIGNHYILSKKAGNYCWFTNEDGNAQFTITVPFDGTGADEDHAWEITNVKDLNLLAKCVTTGEYEFTNEYLKMTGDEYIYDATTSAQFEPIGFYDGYGGYTDMTFKGKFNGNNKTITNLTYSHVNTGGSAASTVGIFGRVAGDISNLNVKNCTFSGADESMGCLGAIAGYQESGTIKNCTVEGCTLTAADDVQNENVGGIVGTACGTIDNCTVTGGSLNVTITKATAWSAGSICAGGIAGSAEDASTTVQDCVVNGVNVKASHLQDYAYAGGIIGRMINGTMTGNRVKGSMTVEAVDVDDASYAFAGAISGDGIGTDPENNKYEYNVKVKINATLMENYTKRAAHWGYAPDDVFGDYTADEPNHNGAMMDVWPATVPAANTYGSKVEFIKNTIGEDCYNIVGSTYFYAPGQTITLKVTTGEWTPGDIRTYYDQLTTLTMNGTDIKDALLFTMPEAEATVSATFTLSEWFTVPTNGKNWMSFYQTWGDYTVASADEYPGIDVEVKTVTDISAQTGVVEANDINGCYSGVPTLFYYAVANASDAVLPPKLKFTPIAGVAAANQTPHEKFKGVAVDTPIGADKIYYMMNGDGDFVRAYITATNKTLTAHRCYIDLSNDPTAGARVLHIVDGGENTGIHDVICDDHADGFWYSLDGRRLNGKPTKKGLFINNGKKIAIK